MKERHELNFPPELVNTTPNSEGWMIRLKPDNPAEMDTLLDAAGYHNMLKGL